MSSDFGDLYSDVVNPFSSSAAPQAHHPPHLHHPIVLNHLSTSEPMVLDSKHEPTDAQDVKFDIEEGGSGGIDDIRPDDPIFPGLTEPVRQEDSGWNCNENGNGIRGGEAEVDEGDGCDSDSEDDLQIVLNDSRMGEDEDENPPVIVADADANQGMEEQGLGEEGGLTADGEKKGGGEAGKVGTAAGGSMVAPKIGYSNHGYQEFHSQFKYVRPGAAPTPGADQGQICPITSVMAGRGRGDWRPHGMKAGTLMQKGFHPNFGMPGGVNNMAGRGFGGGLEFTLPSHKTIFNVDIDSFEEKLWKYPGIDLSDFFNFGLNEESWKDYCKQLELHYLETTMQSKIRVYESGRTEQGYDPDLPPELAAATGQEVLANAANLPTGKAIQVEGSSRERLPSIDMRPPRILDSEVIIEIACGVEDQTEIELPREDLMGDLASDTDVAHEDNEYFDGFPDAYNSRKRELLGKRTIISVCSSVPEDYGNLPFPAETSRPYGPESRSQSPMCPSGNFESPPDERHRQERACETSPHKTSIQGVRDKFSDGCEEESVESINSKSPLLVGDAWEVSVERKDAVDDEHEPADGSTVIEKEELVNGTHKDVNSLNPMKNGKNSFQVEQRKLHAADEDSRDARSSEHSKTRSGSSKDFQKWQEGAEEEVVQGGCLSGVQIFSKHLEECDQRSRRKYFDGRPEMERNHMICEPREDLYRVRNFAASSSHDLPIKTEGLDRQREHDNPEGNWQKKEDDHYSRKNTTDYRKRGRDDEISSRYLPNGRESARSERDDYPPSKKQLDNGNYKVHCDKDISARYSERDDNLKSGYEAADDYQRKRRKDEEYLRRDRADKEGTLHGHRESSSSHRKQERDEILHLRKRDEQQRIKDNFEEHHSVRQKDEVWLHKERVEKDEWHRLKQLHHKSLSKQERGQRTVRSGHGLEGKAWVGSTRTKDEHKISEKEYQLKETVRNSEQVKRRDRNDDDSFSRHRRRKYSYARGHQFNNDERNFGQERSSTRTDHAVNASDSQRGHAKKHKESTRKTRESEGGDAVILGSSKRSREDLSGRNNEAVCSMDSRI
ncbi:hypothetical protein V6N13_119009 [Hibiscus sabdariffa]